MAKHQIIRALSIAAALVGALGMISEANARKEPLVSTDYGAPPTWERFQELGEAALKAVLIDPDSAKIEWPSGYVKAGYTPILSHRIYGYSTCGLVNSRNRMGGYAGQEYFVVVIDNDLVRYVSIARQPGDYLSNSCAMSHLPPVSSMGDTATNVTAQDSGPGLSLSAQAQGLYIEDVKPRSAAARAGLKADSVITNINGMAAKGMDATVVTNLLGAAKGPVTLTMLDGKTITIALEETPPNTAAGQPVAAKPKP